MNPCECVFNHEMAMRRLLSILRQTQDNCNDSECFEITDSNGAGGLLDNNFMMYSMLWIVVGFLLYFYRPSSLRNAKNNFERFNDGDNDDNAGPSRMAPNVQ